MKNIQNINDKIKNYKYKICALKNYSYLYALKKI